MKRLAAIVPFPFADFAASSMGGAVPALEPIVAPPAETLSAVDIERAFADGLAAGRTEAAGAVAAGAERLSALVETVAAECARRDAMLDLERERLRAALQTFLAAFCERLFARNATPLALSLVDRLLDASRDRSPAALIVSKPAFEAFASDLAEAIAARGAEFIRVDADESLREGECRLVWRGGAAGARLETTAAEVNRILAAAPDFLEKTDGRLQS